MGIFDKTAAMAGRARKNFLCKRLCLCYTVLMIPSFRRFMRRGSCF